MKMWTLKSTYSWRNWKRNLRQQIVTESAGASLACLGQYLLRSRARNLFLRKAKQLKDTEGYKSVFISPDRSGSADRS